MYTSKVSSCGKSWALVNGDNDFTVLKIGTTRTATEYNVHGNTFDFIDGEARFILEPGEIVAPGFINGYADGSSSGIGSTIVYNWEGDHDEIWFTGGPAEENSGMVQEGLPPIPGDNTFTHILRSYQFNISLSVRSPLCIDHLVTDSTLPSGHYKAGLTITSDGVMNSMDNVIFETYDHVLLGAGFEVPAAATFEVRVGEDQGCVTQTLEPIN